MDLKQYIRAIPDFPEPGILFRDITPLLRDTQAFKSVVDRLIDHYSAAAFDAIVAVESRGFLFGAPMAYQMSKPFVPVRKKGKLPGATHATEYSLEYGSSIMEVHVGDIAEGDRVLILDDLLATGGTLDATARLVEVSGGSVVSIGLVIELMDLGGRERLSNYDVFSLVQY
ncbi:MAG: adenine phosphoribosyltransferase [Chloroflexi bacterium]|nr:adenine phosphoribosyltransferase [Chloroflexota bacterium]MDA1220119.1 adenine phosphoribosyltransferase [Chloroflexota bacterium]